VSLLAATLGQQGARTVVEGRSRLPWAFVIVPGWTVDDERWRVAIRAAVQTPYIVQERVKLPAEPFRRWSRGRCR
jgi:hypothetical protein